VLATVCPRGGTLLEHVRPLSPGSHSAPDVVLPSRLVLTAAKVRSAGASARSRLRLLVAGVPEEG
jgi:hypothetical protein